MVFNVGRAHSSRFNLIAPGLRYPVNRACTRLKTVFLFLKTEDGLICVKDYKKYLASNDMDVSKAEEHFNSMLTVSAIFQE